MKCDSMVKTTKEFSHSSIILDIEYDTQRLKKKSLGWTVRNLTEKKNSERDFYKLVQILIIL